MFKERMFRWLQREEVIVKYIEEEEKRKVFLLGHLGKKIGVITISILLVLVIGGGAAAAAYVTSKVDRMEVKQLDAQKLEINQRSRA